METSKPSFSNKSPVLLANDSLPVIPSPRSLVHLLQPELPPFYRDRFGRIALNLSLLTINRLLNDPINEVSSFPANLPFLLWTKTLHRLWRGVRVRSVVAFTNIRLLGGFGFIGVWVRLLL